LRRSKRVWAVASVHGEAERLKALHRKISGRLQPGDRLVYLGNFMGRGPRVRETIEELLAFRGRFLAGPRAFPDDIAHLRGGQEEMWQKLLQVQFASDPRGVLQWMLDQGLAATLESYGIQPRAGLSAAASGTVPLTRWTTQLARAFNAWPGHLDLTDSLRRAAYTDDGQLLFVNAGIDPQRPLETQRDTFWWGGSGFHGLEEPYGSYRRVVRGYAPEHPGIQESPYTATVDGGCGFGGALIAACFAIDGTLVDSVEA